MWRLWTTDASLRWVSSAMSLALSNFAGFTLSTLSVSTSRCYITLSAEPEFVGPDPTYAPVIALDNHPATPQLLDNPSLDKGMLWILKPHISLAREVVLPFDSPHNVGAPSHVLGLDKRRSKRARDRGAASRRVPLVTTGARAGRKCAVHGALRMGSRVGRRSPHC